MTTSPTDWRTYDTDANRQRFAAAQTRLDFDLHPPGPVGDAQRREDEKFTDRAFPEPADGARIEWEGAGGTLYAAYRQDLPEHEGGSWWLYGSDERMSWRALVGEYRLPAGLADVAMLVEETVP